MGVKLFILSVLLLVLISSAVSAQGTYITDEKVTSSSDCEDGFNVKGGFDDGVSVHIKYCIKRSTLSSEKKYVVNSYFEISSSFGEETCRAGGESSGNFKNNQGKIVTLCVEKLSGNVAESDNLLIRDVNIEESCRDGWESTNIPIHVANNKIINH